MTDLSQNKNNNARANAIYAVLGWLALLGILIWLNPRWASLLLREYKARVDVHFLYGSTTGKALWNPVFIFLSFLIINIGGKFKWHRIMKRPPMVFSIVCVVLLSIGLWFKAYRVVGDTLTEYKVNPYEEGQHFQKYKDGNLYFENVLPEHPHSFKVVAHKLLLRNKNYITGEGFAAIHDFDIAWPATGIIISLTLYLASLLFLSHFSLAASFSYVLGYYIVFFSYFDGGMLTGMPGLFFMFLATQLDRPEKNKFVNVLSYVGLFAATHFIMIALQCIFHKIDHSLMRLPLTWYFAMNSAPSRLAFLILLVCGSQQTSGHVKWMLIPIGVGLYLSNYFLWNHDVPYSERLHKGDNALVFLNSGLPVEGAKPMLKFKNAQLLSLPVTKNESKWDFCQDLIYKTEGRSYRGLSVTIYCQVLNRPTATTQVFYRLPYRILERGTTRCEMTPELSNNFKIKKISENKNELQGISEVRTYGIPFCLDDTTLLVSNTYGG